MEVIPLNIVLTYLKELVGRTKKKMNIDIAQAKKIVLDLI